MSKIPNKIGIYTHSTNSTEYASIYTSLSDLEDPAKRLELMIPGIGLCYAQLGTIGAPGGTNGRATLNGIAYQIMNEAVSKYVYSLNGLTFRDGGSFPGTLFTLGTFTLGEPRTVTGAYTYQYTANEPRGGTTGTQLCIDGIPVVTATAPSNIKVSGVFSGSGSIALGAGTHTVTFGGYKPKWHGMTSATGQATINLQ